MTQRRWRRALAVAVVLAALGAAAALRLRTGPIALPFLHPRIAVALGLTRREDGTWLVGSREAGSLFDAGAGGAGGQTGLPRIHLARTHIRIDDRRAGGRIAISDGDLLLSFQGGGLRRGCIRHGKCSGRRRRRRGRRRSDKNRLRPLGG